MLGVCCHCVEFQSFHTLQLIPHVQKLRNLELQARLIMLRIVGYSPSNPLFGQKVEDGKGASIVFCLYLSMTARRALLALMKEGVVSAPEGEGEKGATCAQDFRTTFTNTIFF